jgi:hypothetical protein
MAVNEQQDSLEFSSTESKEVVDLLMVDFRPCMPKTVLVINADKARLLRTDRRLLDQRVDLFCLIVIRSKFSLGPSHEGYFYHEMKFSASH